MFERNLVRILAAALPSLGGRIRPNQARHDDAFPLAVYSVNSQEDPMPQLDGAASSFLDTDFDLSFVAETYAEAQQLGEAARLALVAVVNAAQPGGGLIAYIRMTSASDDEEEREGWEPLHIRQLSFTALFQPA